MPITNPISKLRHCVEGNAALVMALALPVLIGGAGMAIDMIQWASWKRELQRSADSAALAGAMSLARQQDVQAAVARDLSLTNGQALSATPIVETPPTTGTNVNNNRAVRVQLQLRNVLPFSSIFMASAPLVRATAVARGAEDGEYCVIALERTSALSIEMQGSSTMALGCGMATNGTGANAIQFNGTASSIQASPVGALWPGTTAYSWGYNLSGQLGDGTTDDVPVPVPVLRPGAMSESTLTPFSSAEFGKWSPA